MSPEQIASLIGQAIREKIFEPGAPLIQEDLARRFNVSRNPVREALKILAAQGVVSMPPGGSGATVRKLCIEDLQELYDLRLVLEPQIAAYIVRNATGRDVLALKRLAEQMDALTDVTGWMRSNFEFHSSLYALAERPHSESVLRSLLSSVQPYSLEHIEKLGGRTQASEEHLAMVDAIEGADAEALAGLFVRHLETARDRLADYFTPDSPEDPLDALRGLWAVS